MWRRRKGRKTTNDDDDDDDDGNNNNNNSNYASIGLVGILQPNLAMSEEKSWTSTELSISIFQHYNHGLCRAVGI